MNKIISGKKFADEVCAKLKAETTDFIKSQNIVPSLAVILVGNDPASKVYVANKNRKAKELGFASQEILLPENISEENLLKEINKLNENNKIHGILVQLPLPQHINKDKIINAIKFEKDVDGFNIKNVGLLYTGQDSLVPCTPQGCLMLLEEFTNFKLSGKNAVIIGRSNIVGRPMAELLLQKNCTTTIIHSKTQNIKTIVSAADIIIAAVGRANFVKSDMVKKDAIIIDVGINRIKVEDKFKLVGDVDFDDVYDKVSAITPVPGGVGPMTIACLMKNTLKAAKLSNCNL